MMKFRKEDFRGILSNIDISIINEDLINLFLAGFDNATIMAASGHKSTKQFIQYVKASNEEHIKKLSEYWKEQNIEANGN